MNIKQISYSLIGCLMFVGTCVSCNNDKYEIKSKNDAVKYLNGNDLLKAERFASQQKNDDIYNGEAIAYWDSLLIEAKSKEAYLKGMQVIKDSADGKFFRKEKFKANLDTILTGSIIENSINEYANYTNAEDFIKARNNAPENIKYGFKNNLIGTTHYWNLITIAGKQNEAYKKGMEDARMELKGKNKIPF